MMPDWKCLCCGREVVYLVSLMHMMCVCFAVAASACW